MIEFVKGDLFQDTCQAIVNTVNCVGIMGRGVALQFKKRYPQNFKDYERACNQGLVVPGRMFVHDTGLMIGPRWIINFPTKRHWKGASKLEDISAGLEALASELIARGITSVALPPLGCGLGGLEWRVVKDLIVSKLSRLPETTRVLVHEPEGAPELVRNIAVPKMSKTIASIILLAKGYLDAMLDPMITLIEIQKLMYFLQESGEELRLDYIKYQYGPYARNLRFVLREMEGHYLRGYGDGGEQPNKPLMVLPGAVADAESFLAGFPDTRKRINAVLSLVDGFETPDAMELLATVHWLKIKENINTLDSLEKAVHGWTPKKARFSKWQIDCASRKFDVNPVGRP